MSKARTKYLHKRMLMHKDRSREEVEEIVKQQILDVYSLRGLTYNGNRGTIGGTNETVRNMRETAQSKGTKALPSLLQELSREVYEGKSPNLRRVIDGAKDEGQLQVLREHLSKEGGTLAEAMREMWGCEIGEASPRLQRAIERYMALSSLSSKATLNLDGTKVGAHPERVKALLRGERVAPITIDMALTQKCSYACTFCYAGLQQNDQSPVPWKVYENFLDDCVEIGHAPGEGVKAISLVSDGESTENPNYLRFIKKARENGIEVAAGTNGFKLKWEELPDLVENLTYLRFNFDAAEPKAYAEIMGTSEKSYETVLDNIKECVRLKEEIGSDVTIGLQMVLLPEYADQVLPLAMLGRNIGVDYTIFKHCSDDESGRLGVDYDWYNSPIAIELLRAAEGLSTETYSVQAKWSKMRTGRDRTYSRCYGTPLLLQMSGTGIVAPCGSFFHEKYSRYHIGDIKETRFRDIWASDAYEEVMDYLRSDEFDPRTSCATLCLQDRLNVALYEYIHDDEPLPPASTMHRNFI